MDLILTGSFIDSASLFHVGGNKYKINFADSKSAKLIQQYGDDIQSINQSEFNKLCKTLVLPNYIKAVKQYAKIR